MRLVFLVDNTERFEIKFFRESPLSKSCAKDRFLAFLFLSSFAPLPETEKGLMYIFLQSNHLKRPEIAFKTIRRIKGGVIPLFLYVLKNLYFAISRPYLSIMT